MVEPKIYVADLAAYNNGKLHGVWIDATLALDDIQDAVAKMLSASPEGFAEEYAIHDYEGFGTYRVSEYDGLESVQEIACFIDEYGALGAEVLERCSDTDEARRVMDEDYQGQYASLADYAHDFTQDTSTVPAHLETYIDYERMGEDMRISGDIFTVELSYDEVHVFWSR